MSLQESFHEHLLLQGGGGGGGGVSSYLGSINRAGSCEVARALSLVVDFKLRPQEPEGGSGFQPPSKSQGLFW